MKLLILHLSDMHFRKANAYSGKNVEAIVSALQQSVKGIRDILIIFSGDLAFQGFKNEYEQVDNFIKALKSSINDRYHITDIKVVLVPGNHDVNYKVGTALKSADLKSINDNDEFEQRTSSELEKMKSFLVLSRRYGCFKDKKKLSDIHFLELDGKKIQLNLINSGVFSSLDEDQGFHYIPKQEIGELSKNYNSDFVITVMHHPHHWYNWRIKKDLESVLYERSDVLLCGHEHFDSRMNIESNNGFVSINAGGQLCNVGNWDYSKFYIATLDLDTRDFKTTLYSWDIQGNVYVESEKKRVILAFNRLNSLELKPREDYAKQLYKDEKYAISKDINDYFVFPLLEKEDFSDSFRNVDIESPESFLSEIEKNRKVYILGYTDDGKTTLAKYLFRRYSATKLTVFLESENIRKGSPESIIRDAFERIYSDDPSKFEKFKQLNTEEKVLIIDDTDRIPEDYLDSMIEYAEGNFGYIILFSRTEIEFNIIERLNKRKIMEECSVFKLRQFYKDRREELVTKLVSILVSQDEETKSKIISTITEVLSRRKGLFSWSPDFIVQFTKYYCNNIGESVQNDGSIYSKVFESNLTSLIKPHLRKPMTADKAFIVLDKIAFQMHIEKKVPMELSEICEVIQKYNNDYGSQIDPDEFIHMALDAGILGKLNGGYRFAQRNYLAYFVAREIRRRSQAGDYSEFRKALEYACYEINADIILFVTYITDNINMITTIMAMTSEYTKDWAQFEANPIKVQYLADSNQLMIPAVKKTDKEENEQEEIEQEKKIEEHQKELSLASPYNYEEGELRLANRMIRGVSLMSIISRILPNFEHMMPKDVKEQCVELIYTLPLRIFNEWAVQLDQVKVELIKEIQDIDDFRYKNEKLFKSEGDVLAFLRWESMSLLLDLMRTSIYSAAKDNTYAFLDNFNYKDLIMYRIEHLIEIGKQDNVDAFDKEACDLYEEAKQGFTKNLVQRVTRRYIITSKKITSPKVQRLNSKIFNEGIKNPTLIRHKAAKMEGMEK